MDLVDIRERMAEMINDEITMYFDAEEDGTGDMELAWFITETITNYYQVVESVDVLDSSMTISFTTQELEDVFAYCVEHNLQTTAFVKDKIMDLIHE